MGRVRQWWETLPVVELVPFLYIDFLAIPSEHEFSLCVLAAVVVTSGL